jgi:enoyl-CoA hydratase/carnithine racemase
MSYTTFSTHNDGTTLTVTFNQGDVNIMSATMAAELFALVGQLTVDTQTKVVVFESANDEFFIAHFDINDIIRLIEGDDSIPLSKTSDLNVLQCLGLSIQNLPQLTMAKIDGICRGGGFELILALDMCFASEQSKFCFPEASAGFLPAGGGSTLLPLKAGNGRALEVMLTGRDFSGAEAERYNFINRSFETSAELNAYVADTVKRIAATDISAIAAVKSVPKKTFSVVSEGVFAGLAQENVAMAQCLADPVVIEKLRQLAASSGTHENELDLPKTIAALITKVND